MWRKHGKGRTRRPFTTDLQLMLRRRNKNAAIFAGASGGSAQSPERGLQALQSLLGGGGAFALLLHHVLGRARREVLVAELGVDLVDLAPKLAGLFFETRLLRLQIDDIRDRQGERRLVDDHLDGTGRGGLGHVDRLEPRKLLHLAVIARCTL